MPSRSRAGAAGPHHHHHPGPHPVPKTAGPRPSSSSRWGPGPGGQWGAAVLAAGLVAAAAAEPAAPEGAAEAFGRSCAGCHPGGGNVVAGPGKSLSTQDLEANGVLDANAMFQVSPARAAAAPRRKG